jgi:hypothetical protein
MCTSFYAVINTAMSTTFINYTKNLRSKIGRRIIVIIRVLEQTRMKNRLVRSTLHGVEFCEQDRGIAG